MRLELRHSLLVAAGALSIAGLMAAYSYTSATISNTAYLSVKSTDTALLALLPASPYSPTSTPDPDVPVSEQNGVLVFDFNHGLGGGEFGLQDHSTYTFMDLFTVRNDSENQVAVNLSAQNLPSGVTLYAQPGEFGVDRYWVDASHENGGFVPLGATVFTLKPFEWVEIDVKAVVAADAPQADSMQAQLIVNGVAVGGDQ